MASPFARGLTLILLLTFSACSTAREPETTADEPTDATPAIYESPGGQTIEIVNASEKGFRLLSWAFSRFAAAALPEPIVSRIHFANGVADCDVASGWTRTVEGAVEIAICHTEDEICRQLDGAPLAANARMCALHELAHGWLLAHADESVKTELMGHAGLAVWRSADVPWHERGAEHAAEVVAWGLMDRRLPLNRLGRPGCELATERFVIVTGTDPLVRCR